MSYYLMKRQAGVHLFTHVLVLLRARQMILTGVWSFSNACREHHLMKNSISIRSSAISNED